jgi:hypothetical protein
MFKFITADKSIFRSSSKYDKNLKDNREVLVSKKSKSSDGLISAE